MMCKGIELDKNQKEILQHCIAESKDPQRSRWARFRNGLTMVLVGMHAAGNRLPDRYDDNNRLF